jgi:16S rRNA (adenine1518-N6/adenine1519-N6)-dimethyltransferase
MTVVANQTVSFLMKRFAEAGIRIKGKHGQNFLIDLNLLRLLVDAAKLDPHDVVLEVGTGTGSLTAHIAPFVAAIVTVEIDPQMHQLASEELYQFPNVTLLQQDALRTKNQIDAAVLDSVRERLGAAPDRRFKLVANLPYNVATPIVTNLLATQLPLESMTITIQKELAERMMAKPSTKDYSALSIWVQSQCRVELVRILPPTVFWPRPKVHSAILHIEVDSEKQARIPDREYFHTFVRAMFFHRRKFLRSQLLSACGDRLDKAQVDAVLASLNLSPELRAEQLEVETMLQLCEAVRAAEKA